MTSPWWHEEDDHGEIGASELDDDNKSMAAGHGER